MYHTDTMTQPQHMHIPHASLAVQVLDMEAPACKRVHHCHGPVPSFSSNLTDSEYELENERLEREIQLLELEIERLAIIDQLPILMETWAMCPPGWRWGDDSDSFIDEAPPPPLPSSSAASGAAGESAASAAAGELIIDVGSIVRVGGALRPHQQKLRGLVGRVLNAMHAKQEWAILFPNGEHQVFHAKNLQVVDDEEYVAHAIVDSSSGGDSHAPQLRTTKVAMLDSSMIARVLVAPEEEVFTCADQIAMMDKAGERTAVLLRMLEARDTLRAVPGHDEVVVPGVGDTWRLLCHTTSRQEGYVRMCDKHVRPLRSRSSLMKRTHHPKAAVCRYYNSTSTTFSLYTVEIQAGVAVAADLSASFFVLREAPKFGAMWPDGNPICFKHHIRDDRCDDVDIYEMPVWAGFCRVQVHNHFNNWPWRALPPGNLQMRKLWRQIRKRVVQELLRLFAMLARARSDYAFNYFQLQVFKRMMNEREGLGGAQHDIFVAAADAPEPRTADAGGMVESTLK